VAGDGIDPDSLVLPPDVLAEIEARAKGRRRPRIHSFAKVPHDAGIRMAMRAHTPQWAVALEIDRLRLKAGGRLPVKLGNGTLERLGVSRFMKDRGLRQLEKLGVAVIERAPGRAPLIVAFDWARRPCT
jgi:hypothetical protein